MKLTGSQLRKIIREEVEKQYREETGENVPAGRQMAVHPVPTAQRLVRQIRELLDELGQEHTEVWFDGLIKEKDPNGTVVSYTYDQAIRRVRDLSMK